MSMNEWVNYGDVNFTEYGGVMLRQDDERPNDYHFFKLDIDDYGDMYAFSGTVCDINEYADERAMKEGAQAYGYDDAESFIKNSPELAALELLSNYGCGVFEFSPSNHNGTGQYSLRMEDFRLCHNELVSFMEELEIPGGFIPQWQVDFENAKITGTGDCYLTDENEKAFCTKIKLPTDRDLFELYRKIFAVPDGITKSEFENACKNKGLNVTVTLAIENDESYIVMCCSSPYSFSNNYDMTVFLSDKEKEGVEALCEKDETIEFFGNLKAEFTDKDDNVKE